VLVSLAWALNSVADSLSMLYVGMSVLYSAASVPARSPGLRMVMC